MINVKALANGAIQSVNENIVGQWLQSTGRYTTDAAGHRVPEVQAVDWPMQIQPMSSGDIQFTDGLNIQGVMRSVYMLGNVQGVVRADSKGGDLLMFPQSPGRDPQPWRVIQVTESWPSWSKVIAVLQA